MTTSLDSLPAELLTLILEHAQHNDSKARSQWGVSGQSKDTTRLAQQQQHRRRIDSALQMSRTSSRLYTASLSVLYEVSGGGHQRAVEKQ